MDGLEETYAEAEELPDEVDRRLGEIETALAAFDDRPQAFDPEEVARAGAFVSIDGSGVLRIERGSVRHEDERPIAPENAAETEPANAPPSRVRTGHGGAGRLQGSPPVLRSRGGGASWRCRRARLFGRPAHRARLCPPRGRTSYRNGERRRDRAGQRADDRGANRA